MLNGNDLELLSAYLDGALNERERTALEARLQTDAELRRELARLRATVDLVKTLPTLSSPRPLTLTPRMIRRPTVWTSAAFSALSTAAAIVLLVIGAALFTSQQAAAPAARQIAAFATTTQSNEPAADGLANSNTVAQPPLVGDDFQTTLQKVTEEIALQTGALDLAAAPTRTPQATVAPLLYAAAAPTETANIEEFSADSSLAQSQTSAQGDIDQQRTQAQQEQSAQQAAPSSLASGGAAAEAPLPAPTLILPTATQIPTETATITPSDTPSPTNTASPSPSPTASPVPTLAPTPVPHETPAAETSTVGIGLIAAALVLFGVAIVTTILRRRA